MTKVFRLLIGCGALLFAAACGSGGSHDIPLSEEEAYQRDLHGIKRHGKLRALTTYSATSYFLYKGEAMGFEYELLKRFADDLGVELELVVARDLDSVLHMLNSGEVDLVANGLTVTLERLQEAAFTDHLYLTHQVLVQRKPQYGRPASGSAPGRAGKLVLDPIELLGDTVSVRLGTAYFQRLKNLAAEMGGQIIIDTLSGNISTEEIIQMVADGKIKYTLADNNLAAINATYYPSLHVEVAVGFSQRVAWAVRHDAPELLIAANSWIASLKRDPDYPLIYNNYFGNRHAFRRRVDSEFYSLTNNTISPFDDLIRQEAARIGWDWRLLTSVVYQESRFEPHAAAWSSASGLMQLMPATAEALGVSDPTDPAESLRGGADYLHQLWKHWDAVPDSLDRIKFTLASYNCGYGHVLDAQRLAEKRGLNPLVWTDNVSDMLLALSYPKNYSDEVVYYGYVRGVEVYAFVEQIFERYGRYRQFAE